MERLLNTTTIRIPDNLLMPKKSSKTPETLINVVFPNIFSGVIEINSAILTRKNSDRNEINSITNYCTQYQ